MRVRAFVPFVCALLFASPAAAQATDPVAGLLLRIEAALRAGETAAMGALIAAEAEAAQIEAVTSELDRPNLVQVTLKERDRQVLADDQGVRLLVDVLAATPSQARVATWRLDLAPPVSGSDGTPEPFHRIRSMARLSLLDALFRLSLAPRQYAVRNLTIAGDDIEVHVPEGMAWIAEANGLPTALVVFGGGDVRFTPAPPAEQGQLELFTGERSLRTRVSRVFVRLNPADVDLLLNLSALRPAPIDRRQMSRAERFFDEQVEQSFSLDLQDLSDDTWSLVPPLGDLLLELDTSRHGLLSYSRSGNSAEDISLFDRKKRKNLSVYSSARQLALRGSRYYDEAAQLDYTIEHYNVDVSYDPARSWLEGRADLDVLVQTASTTTLTLRLAEELTVRAVTSDQFGRLLTLKVRGQNNVIVNFPGALRRGDRLRLRVAYGGALPPQRPEREALDVAAAGQPVLDFVLEPEPRYTYSIRSWWYPQTPVTSYATARMRVTVPDGFSCVATGVGEPPEAIVGADGRTRQAFVFRASQPVRYLSFVAARLEHAATGAIIRPLASSAAVTADRRRSRLRPGAFYEKADLEVWSHRRQSGRAEDTLRQTTDILRFYQDIVDDVPYPLTRVVVVEDTLPGGHSPAYFALLHQPVPGSPFIWGRDPVAFDNFPEFFLAHELAHQFWGQAVGWESYHEQWISEGFSQYFAAMYAERVRSADDFTGILRQLYRSALDADEQGPVWLGYRLGHLRNDSRVFRAIVYNKGALVLHMLRRMIGDDAFTRGLQRFYGLSRFQRVGTDQLRAAFEHETGRRLDTFFERWIHENGVPTLVTSWTVTGPSTDSGGALSTASPASILHVTLEQDADRPAPLAVTVTVIYTDGRTDRAIAQVEGERTELSLPVTGPVRDVRFNDDYGALVRIERARR